MKRRRNPSTERPPMRLYRGGVSSDTFKTHPDADGVFWEVVPPRDPRDPREEEYAARTSEYDPWLRYAAFHKRLFDLSAPGLSRHLNSWYASVDGPHVRVRADGLSRPTTLKDAVAMQDLWSQWLELEAAEARTRYGVHWNDRHALARNMRRLVRQRRGVVKRKRGRAARPNPAVQIDVRREFDVTQLWVHDGLDRLLAMLEVGAAGASGAHVVYARVHAPNALAFTGTLRADGSLRWRGARAWSTGAGVALDEALEDAGASLDRLLELYFQELSAGRYTLAEWP